MTERYLAFLSYAHRYRGWVEAFHRNLEACLEHGGRAERVFFDRKDLASGVSWVGGLQGGIAVAEQLILVLTPEALASEWVTKEWQSFLASGGPSERLHVVHLVDTPGRSLPPFLADLQWLDFRDHDADSYRASLRRLLAGLLGEDPRAELELPAELEAPPAPPALPAGVRARLRAWMESILATRFERRAAESLLGLGRNVLEGPADPAGAAALAVALATADDDPLAAAKRITAVLAEELASDRPDTVAALRPLQTEIDELARRAPERGLLRAWLDKVVADHERLVPYFQQRAELDLLERVYVQLELRAETRGMEESLGRALDERKRYPDRPWTLRRLLELEPDEEPWVTRRWVVLGDPGAGKTTLLRHLAATVAADSPPTWVPVFESLPRLMREPQWLLDRIARQMRRAGHPAEGLAAVLERSGEEGRLLLLFDGLDEVPRDDRDEAEALLREVARRWPRTPIVVSSRPIGYRRPRQDFVELELLPFDRRRRQEFLGRWFGRARDEPDEVRGRRAATTLDADPVLRELAGNPLYLTLMALLVEQGTEPDRNRAALYDQVFELLLGGRHREPPTPMERPPAVRRMLRHLGYGMTDDNRDAEPVGELEDRLYRPEADALRGELERVGRWRPRLGVFLEDLAERTGILGPHDGAGADWRFWHRTFREALAAETLAEILREDGEKAVLERAREVSGDLSRWAEPYALLAGQAKDADALVEALVAANQSLGLRALATVQGLRDETVDKILAISDDRQARAEVYQRVPELVGEPRRALALLDRLRRRTHDGDDLFHLERAVTAVAGKWPDAQRDATGLRSRFYNHCSKPAEELFRWVETPAAGRVELWWEIPPGSFLMGSPAREKDRYPDEGPQHRVAFASPFAIATVPVTNAQYAAFEPGYSPESWGGVADDELPRHPAVRVSWYQATSFCRWLASCFEWARGARLPTEEEWEYACRAGTETRYWSGDGEADLARVGWHGGNSGGRTHAVGEKPANPWGLHDLHGNVLEWTLSAWTDDYSEREDGAKVDPSAVDLADLAADGGERRVIRGGGYWNGTRNARSAYRNHRDPGSRNRDLGFRVLLPAAPRF